MPRVKKMTPKTKSRLLYFSGLLISVLPVLLATLSYFPLWCKRGGEYALSGITLILLIIAALPLLRTIRARLRSPSAYTVWLIIFLLFYALSKIADEVVVIAFVGFISNLIGAFIFSLSRKIRGKGEKPS